MNMKEQLAALVKAMQAVVKKAKDEDRDLTAEEITEIEQKSTEVETLKGKIAQAAKSQQLIAQVGAVTSEVDESGEESSAKSLGEHFVKSGALERFRKGSGQRTATATEFKAATDPFVTGGDLGQTQYGRVVATPLRRLTIADLLGKGTLSASSLTYWTQGAVTGAPTAVAENGQKPSINFTFSPVTEALTKLAVLTKVSDEAMQDTDYLVSVINTQLTGRLAVVEEDQLLSGNGTSPNLSGLLNRSGIQTYGATSDTKATNLTKIYHGITLCATGTSQLNADGIVINPSDYETLRTATDSNGQFFAGGPFVGAYGQGGIQEQPGLWGVRTVVTSAITAGTVLVGAFGQGAQLFRKGGVQVASTNADGTDFDNNRVALRAEERILLAVYQPTAFVKLTLGTA